MPDPDPADVPAAGGGPERGAGERLRALRVARGIAQGAVAGDYTSSYVSRVEKGIQAGGPRFWAAAAETLGVSQQWLTTGVDDAAAELAGAMAAVAAGDTVTGINQLRALLARPNLSQDLRGEAEQALADALFTRGEYAQVWALLRDRLETPVADPIAELTLRGRMCRCLVEMGDLSGAVDTARTALRRAEELQLPNHRIAIQLRVTLAGALLDRGDMELAAYELQRAQTLAQQAHDPVAEASSMWNAANLAYDRGDLPAAQHLTTTAITLFRQAREDLMAALTTILWADVATRGNLAPPEIVITRLNAVAPQITTTGTAVHTGYLQAQLAAAHHAAGRDQQAEVHALQALAALGADNALETARVRALLAGIQIATGRTAEGIQTAQQAATSLQMCRADRQAARIWIDIAKHHETTGDLTAANQALKQALGLPAHQPTHTR